MPFTLAIVSVIAAFIWIAPLIVTADGPWTAIPVVIVLALCALHNRRSGDWGFSRKAFWPGLGWSIAFTVPLLIVLWKVGEATGVAPPRRAPLLDFLYVLVWGGSQQFVLQTVVLRESRAVAGAWGVGLAALIFAALHLPNPFLVAVTFAGGLAWCFIYTRRPNILPLALSHAAATVVILLSFDPDVSGGLRTGWHYLR